MLCKCKCGCGEYTSITGKYVHKYIKGHKGQKTINKQEQRLCKCGCKKIIPYDYNKKPQAQNKYIEGHHLSHKNNETKSKNLNLKRKKHKPKLCACNCGKWTEKHKNNTRYCKYIKGHEYRDNTYGNNDPLKIIDESIIENFIYKTSTGYWYKTTVKYSDTVKYEIQYCSACKKQILSKADIKNRQFYSCSSKCTSKSAKRAAEQAWRDPEFVAKYLKGKEIADAKNDGPNKPETFLINLFNNLIPNMYKFCGDGTTWIARKNPDFIRIDKKKKQVIEHFGDYWHGNQITGLPREIEERRKKLHFRKYGYECLIIWEHELKNYRPLVRKILNFV